MLKSPDAYIKLVHGGFLTKRFTFILNVSSTSFLTASLRSQAKCKIEDLFKCSFWGGY